MAPSAKWFASVIAISFAGLAYVCLLVGAYLAAGVAGVGALVMGLSAAGRRRPPATR